MNWVIKENVDKEFVSTLSKELNISPILSSMLIKRDIKTFDQAKTFFRPNFEMLHDPFLMKDMSIAVERIQKAVEKKESIMIFGDYDVDGTSSVALLSLYLESLGLCVTKYLPDRKNEGYGISVNAIDNAFDKKQKLIIALDCGIKAHKQVDYAKEKEKMGVRNTREEGRRRKEKGQGRRDNKVFPAHLHHPSGVFVFMGFFLWCFDPGNVSLCDVKRQETSRPVFVAKNFFTALSARKGI